LSKNKKAKREASVLDLTNTNDTKRFKSDQSIAFNNSTNSSNSKINSSCHKTSQAEEKKYSCDTCDKTFSTYGSASNLHPLLPCIYINTGLSN
jgi:hypothetical protein